MFNKTCEAAVMVPSSFAAVLLQWLNCTVLLSQVVELVWKSPIGVLGLPRFSRL